MRRFLFAVAGIVLVLALALVAVAALLPSDRIAALALARVEQATGRKIAFNGGLHLSFYPTFGIAADQVEMANAPWSDQGPMLSAEKVRVGVHLMPLLSGNIRITGITIENPTILLERLADGRDNWTLAPSDSLPATTGGGGGVPDLVLDNVQIRGGTIDYNDYGAGRNIRLADLSIDTALPGGDQPVDLRAAARLSGQALSADLHLAKPNTFLNGGASDIALAAKLGKASLDLKGAAQTDPDVTFTGTIGLNMPDTAATMTALGLSAPSLPKGLGRGVKLSGNLGWAGNKATLTKSALALDMNAISGDMSLALDKDRPNLTATLAAGDLDLTSLREDNGASGPTGPTTEGWSKDPIDLGGLSAIDASVRLRAKSIDLGSSKFGATALAANLKDGKLNTDINELAAYGGSVTGTVTATGKNGATVGGNLVASGVALQSLFADTIGFKRITGAGDMQIAFTGTGHSLDQIMHSLNGTGSFDFTKGEILGVDLISLFKNFDPAKGAAAKTIFDSITASFDIKKGVLNNVDMNFRAPLATAAGSGTVGIGDRVLDYLITPQILPGDTGKGAISVPVRISGSWASPSIRPDLSGIAKAKADAAAKKLEDKAKAKLSEKLGAGTGQSTQDTLKQKAAKELGKGLKGLLGGGN